MKGRLWGALGVVVWALAAGVLAAQLTLPSAALTTVLAVLLGISLAPRLAYSRVRFAAFWVAGLMTSGMVLAVCAVLRDTPLGAAMLGPVYAYTVAEDVGWFTISLVTVLVLRASSLRFRACLILEVAVVASTLAAVFAGHREGFINRPFFLVDPIWAQGWDPLPAFLAIGALLAGLVVVLIATQRSERRSFVDLALLLALVVGIFALLPQEKLKDLPQIRQQLEGKPKKQGKHPAGSQSGKGDNNASPSPDPNGTGQGGGQTQQDWKDDPQFKDEQSGSSNQPVAVVVLHSDTDPASGFYYFRQTAFSQFNGQRLIRDTSGQADLDVAEFFPTGAMSLPHDPTVPGTDVDVDTTVALLTAHTHPFGLVNANTLTSIANPDVRRFQRAYDVKSQVVTKGLLQLLPYEAGDPTWDAAQKQHYLDTPLDPLTGQTDPRYVALTNQILNSLRPDMRDHPLARAAAIKLWLEKNGTYSLKSQYADSADPVSDFLFGDRTGYCVYFAHAATFLMRTAGIPARVGAGYAVNGRNRGSGSALLIRERDSHAWPEIYLQGIGWTVLDIIPQKSIAPPEDPPDSGMQQMLGDMARKGAGNPEDEKQKANHGDLQELLRRLLLFIWHALLPTLELFLIAMYVWKIVRRLQPYVCAEHRLPVLAYRAALDALADQGRVRRYGQTREGFAETHATVCPRLPDLTQLHLRATLGEQEPDVARATVLAWYQSVARDGGRATTWYRHLWGVVNPFTWWQVK